MSHDQKKIRYKIADRSQKAGLRTKTIILEGYSTIVFCTASFQLDQQERTRVWQLSPETSEDKVHDAERLLLEKKGDRKAFEAFLLADANRLALRERVMDVRNSHVSDVIIPEGLRAKILEGWGEKHLHAIPRNVRDLDRFLSLVKASALLNWRTRVLSEEDGCKRIVTDDADVSAAFAIYGEISEANELGLAPHVYEIFKEVIQPIGTAKTFQLRDASGQVKEEHVAVVGVTRQEILREYFRIYNRPLSERRLRKEILESLDASGQIRSEQDPKDKRRDLVYPQTPAPIAKARGVLPADREAAAMGNRINGVGVDDWTENPPLLHPEIDRGASARTPESLPESTNDLERRFAGAVALCRLTSDVG